MPSIFNFIEKIDNYKCLLVVMDPAATRFLVRLVCRFCILQVSGICKGKVLVFRAGPGKSCLVVKG
jgi:hypothetical protein